jgi:hypothetical protein
MNDHAMFNSMSLLGDKGEVVTCRIGEKDNEMSIAAVISPIVETLKWVSLITATVFSRKLYVFLKARVKLLGNTTEIDLVYVVTSLLFCAISKVYYLLLEHDVTRSWYNLVLMNSVYDMLSSCTSYILSKWMCLQDR